MPSLRSNAIRIKRFRELKQDLRTRRDRLLVGIDIAKAQHVAQVRLAHTQVLDKQLVIPNTQAGFAAFWTHLQQRQAETGATEIVCAVEPTVTYHQALAQFLETHGADVVLVSTTVAHHNRRTLDGTWGKTDPKDAHNLGDLLERGHVLFYSLPDERTATLRHLVRLLRHARVDRGACQARFRNTLLPAPAPARGRSRPRGERAPRKEGGSPPALAPALAFECTDLAAHLSAVEGRITQIEAELVRVAQALPVYALLRTLPGVGVTLAAILCAEIGDIAWYTQFSQLRKLAGLDIIWVATGNWTGTARISKCGRPLLRWALYQAALGACRNAGWRARREAMIAKRHGDRFAFFKAHIELAAKLLRLVWGVWRRGRPYDPSYRSGGPAAGPASAPASARAGRCGARPSDPGPSPIGNPRGRPVGRILDTQALPPKYAPRRRGR